MATYGVAEAKNQFTRLLERAENGESITITRHGKPVAELRGTPRAGPQMTLEERRAAYDAFVERRKNRPPLGVPAADLIRSIRDGDPE